VSRLGNKSPIGGRFLFIEDLKVLLSDIKKFGIIITIRYAKYKIMNEKLF
jgi:hypothetical protein